MPEFFFSNPHQPSKLLNPIKAFLLLAFLFLSPAVYSNIVCPEGDTECINRVLESQKEEQTYRRNRDRMADDRQEKLDDERREREARSDLRQEEQDRRTREREAEADAKEQEREVKEALKEREEKCENAENEVKDALEEKDEKQSELEQDFYDLEEDITELEGKSAEEQTKIKTEIENFNRTANNNTQQLKEEMGKELKNIDVKVQQIQDTIGQLHDSLEKVEEDRLTAFYARRKQQNEFYSTCFGKALEQTEKVRMIFYQRKRANTLRRRTLGDLARGGKTQTRNTFSGRFNQFLNLCLNNQAALLQKSNQENEYQLMVEKLNRREERIEQKIAELKTQIANLKSHGKAEILNRYKEKMQQEIQNFEQSYDSLTENYQTNSRQIINQIGKIKHQQASVLMNRAQNALPERTRNDLIVHQCQQHGGGLNVLNMFPSSFTTAPVSRNRGGIFGGSIR